MSKEKVLTGDSSKYGKMEGESPAEAVPPKPERKLSHMVSERRALMEGWVTIKSTMSKKNLTPLSFFLGVVGVALTVSVMMALFVLYTAPHHTQ